MTIFVAGGTPANAGTPSPAPETKVQVQVLSPDADPAPFKKDPRYETHAVPDVGGGAEKSALPSPRERDRLLAKAGLSSALSGWDAVDRDVFFMRAGSLEFDRFKAHYPKLPESALRKLQELVRQ